MVTGGLGEVFCRIQRPVGKPLITAQTKPLFSTSAHHILDSVPTDTGKHTVGAAMTVVQGKFLPRRLLKRCPYRFRLSVPHLHCHFPVVQCRSQIACAVSRCATSKERPLLMARHHAIATLRRAAMTNEFTRMFSLRVIKYKRSPPAKQARRSISLLGCYSGGGTGSACVPASSVSRVRSCFLLSKGFLVVDGRHLDSQRVHARLAPSSLFWGCIPK